MPTIEVDQSITIALSVADRQVSAQWYARHLGFELLFEADDMGWSEMRTNTPGVTLGLGEQASAKAGNCVPVFGVSDVQAARRALEAEGVRFDGDTMTIDGMVKLATFHDPDDNALMIAEDLSAAAGDSPAAGH